MTFTWSNKQPFLGDASRLGVYVRAAGYPCEHKTSRVRGVRSSLTGNLGQLNVKVGKKDAVSDLFGLVGLYWALPPRAGATDSQTHGE
jgi:hypothetical protein